MYDKLKIILVNYTQVFDIFLTFTLFFLPVFGYLMYS